MSFEYFDYGEQRRFVFLQVPKLLLSEERYMDLSGDAKLLYSLMLERGELSHQNGWYDERGRPFIYFTIEDVMEKLRVGHSKASVVLKDLEKADLRVVVHDKSSLAPAGSSLGFILGDDEGFRWVGEYDITANELLTGTKGQNKTQQATDLIRQVLSGGREMLSEDLDKAALSKNISTRTLRDAKKELGDELKSRITDGRKKVFWMS